MMEGVSMDIEQLEIHPNVYYTLEEVATLLRVSRRSAARVLKSGVARGIKIGRHWRVLGRDLLQLPQQVEDSRNGDEVTDVQLRQALMRLSEPTFARVWDNEEDAVYDQL
jgi:excisionase family DNA binding protein